MADDLYDLYELCGAVHLHSTYSDGSDTVEEILAAAREAGLDFFILSDHDTLAARADGLEGWHGGVLAIVGAEVSPDAGDHFLVLGARELPDPKREPDREALMRAAIAAGGAVYIAHPQGPAGRARSTPADELPLWRHWDSRLYHGLEIWAYMHDILQDFRPWRLKRLVRDPDRFVRGPDPRVLRRWDELNRRRRVVGLGVSDNHARRVPLTGWRVLPHAQVFRSFGTHVLARRMTGESEIDIPCILSAISAGRTFAAFDGLADSRQTRFWLEGGDGRRWEMGEELALRPSLMLRVRLPRPADIRIVRDGRTWRTANGKQLDAPVSEAGVYRLEAYLHGRPWIFTNPVLVRA